MVDHPIALEEPEPDLEPPIQRRSSNLPSTAAPSAANSGDIALVATKSLPIDGTVKHSPSSDSETVETLAPAPGVLQGLTAKDYAIAQVEKVPSSNHGAVPGETTGVVGAAPTAYPTAAALNRSTSRLSDNNSTRSRASVPAPDSSGKYKPNFIEPSWKDSFKNTIKSVPVLAFVPVILPIAWALHFTHQTPVAVFVTSLIGIVPLAGGLGFATEELALRVGDAWGGLLNATFGNAVELLIAILALVKGELAIVQAAMIGSILSNILLVLGMSYFAGGLRFHEQIYFVPGAQMQISLLGLTLLVIALPAAYHYAYPSTTTSGSSRFGSHVEGEELDMLLKMSRGLSFILLAAYAMFLTFQLWTHAYLFRIPRERQVHPLPGPVPEHDRVFPKPDWVPSLADSSSASSISSGRSGHSNRSRRSANPFRRRMRRWSIKSKSDGTDEAPASDSAQAAQVDLERQASAPAHETIDEHEAAGVPMRSPTEVHFDDDAEDAMAMGSKRLHEGSDWQDVPLGASAANMTTPGGGFRASSLRPRIPARLTNVQLPRIPAMPRAAENDELDTRDFHHAQPKVKAYFAIGMLVAMTALAGVSAEFLVDSIDGLVATGNVSREFVGLILLPVIGNSVEHVTAVTVSVKDKLNLSMSIAVGSSIQVSLCILPILVLIGWAIGQPLTLFFDTFETISLVISVLLVNFAISDGRTNYLEGFVMMMAYLSIALVCWFYDPAE